MSNNRLDAGASSESVAALITSTSQGPALIDQEGNVLDYQGLRRNIDRLSAQLRAAGLGPSDRIAVVMPNGPPMALVLMATMGVGCVAPLNPKYREDEFRFYLQDLRATALLTLENDAPHARACVALNIPMFQMRIDGFNIDVEATPGEWPLSTSPQSSEVALVLHTSGTTSRPKIVALRQRHLFHSARSIASSLSLSSTDRSLLVMPLFHIHGLMAGLLAPLSSGGSVICTTGFDAFSFHRLLEELQPTYYSAVPTMHQMVLARAPKPHPTSLRFIRSSSAALPLSVFQGLTRQYDVPVIEAYGMTEATHQMTSNPLRAELIKPGSVGVAAGIRVTTLDLDGSELASGVRGEVAVKGETIIDGYENNPEANESAFASGWFRTGDEGVIDGDGYLFLAGRIKEQINRGGEKISPLEIDEVLLLHPAVVEAVAFGYPHEKLGEEIGAAVVLENGSVLTERELRDFVSTKVASFKVPRRIMFVAEIPKSDTGKIRRIGLAEKLGL